MGDAIKQIHRTEPFLNGSVASKSDLLRLRVVRVVECGSIGEIADFVWLLSEVEKFEDILPALDGDDFE